MNLSNDGNPVMMALGISSSSNLFKTSHLYNISALQNIKETVQSHTPSNVLLLWYSTRYVRITPLGSSGGSHVRAMAVKL